MANQQHLHILEEGVNVWNDWRKQHPEIRPDLSGANLSRADLAGVDLHEADLRGVNFSYANLANADLSYADLSPLIIEGSDQNKPRKEWRLW